MCSAWKSDGKDKPIEMLKAGARQLAMPKPVERMFDEEPTKRAHLEPVASEANVTRSYQLSQPTSDVTDQPI